MNKESEKIHLTLKMHKYPKNNELIVMNGNNFDLVNPKLPANFFEKIITTEIELSEEFNHKKLTSLFQLYSTAIQFYSLTDASKVKIYQNRMEYYLTQKDTLKKLTKFNLEKKIGSKFNSNYKIRGRARIKFKAKAKEIKKDEIRKQVKLILKNVKILMKIDKKNLRDIINEELIKQRKNWAKRLYQKRALSNSSSTRIKSISGKVSLTPTLEVRNSLDLENKKEFQKSSKNLFKYKMIDDESSETDNIGLHKENNDDFSDLIKELDGDKNSIINSNYDSIIGSSYDEESESETKEEGEEEKEEEEKEDEEEKEEKEDEEKINKYEDKLKEDYHLDKKSDVIKCEFITINEIDEKNEFEKNNNKNFKYIQNNIEEIKRNHNKKFSSSKYLPILVLSPYEIEDENIIHNTNKKENNENNKKKEENELLRENKTINDFNIKEPKDISMPTKEMKNIDTENEIRKIELDKEIRNLISKKLKIIEKVDDSDNDNTREDSNYQSTDSLPKISKKNNFEGMPLKFHQIILDVENKIKKFVGNINKYFYKEIFDRFYSKLKELYEQKYEQYLKVNEEYFSNIKEKEFLLDSSDKIEPFEKQKIKNIIICLKEEQNDQIEQILDEYNSNINKYIEEFKQNIFKNNIGFQLIEENLKLDVYTMINEAFY